MKLDLFANENQRFLASVDDYDEVKGCIYKGELYSVRDNGAVMRHPREGKPIRKNDNVWSFGKINMQKGYLDFCGQSVHRIVATAFHGEAPSGQHVVDHIDTNRRNNRPENLRWLTKLENILCNEITRKKVELICGSVEAFLDNPQLLYGYESEDKNFIWMRNVTKEEAKKCLENWSHWAKTAKPNPDYKKGDSQIADWIFKRTVHHEVNQIERRSLVEPKSNTLYTTNDDGRPVQEEKVNEPEREPEPLRTQSLTPNAIQLDWKHPVTFPCCPQQFSGNPLEAYMANLKQGALFSTNQFGDSHVLRFGMPQPDCLWVMCRIQIGWKDRAFTKITFKDGIFYHENMGVYDFGDEPEDMFESLLSGEMG